MNRQLSERDKLIIHHEVLLNYLKNSNINLNEGLEALFGKAAEIAGGIEGVLPNSLITGFKKKLAKMLLEKLNIDQGGGFSDFIENVIANISLEHLGKFISGNIECPDVIDILVKAATMSVSKLGIKKVVVPIVHYFSQNEFDMNTFKVTKKRTGGDMKALTEKQVDEMLDTLIGVLGESLLSTIIQKYVLENLIPGMANEICSAIGISSDNSDSSDAGYKFGDHPVPKEPKAELVAPSLSTNQGQKQIAAAQNQNLLPVNETKINLTGFSLNERKRIYKAMELIRC